MAISKSCLSLIRNSGTIHFIFSAFKDGRDNKNLKVHSTKKSRSSWGVKCYFIRKESHAPWTEKDSCILFKKTSHEARCLFMHVHMVSSVAKYISRSVYEVMPFCDS